MPIFSALNHTLYDKIAAIMKYINFTCIYHFENAGVHGCSQRCTGLAFAPEQFWLQFKPRQRYTVQSDKEMRLEGR